MNRFEARSLSLLGLACSLLAGSLCVAGPSSAQEAEAVETMQEETHGHEAHGHETHGHETHGHETHGHEAHGHETYGHEAHGQGHGTGGGETLNAAGFHHDFSDAEHWAKRFDTPDRPTWQKPESLMALMGIEPGMTVADLGAGTGFFLGYLSKVVGEKGRVLALDVEPTLISHMANRAEQAGWSNVETRHIPYDSPGLEPASVDRILIVNTWHHIDARADYSAKLLKALRPGGAIFVVDYTLEAEHGPPKAHRLSPERVAAELTGGGFETEVLAEELPRQYVVVGRAGS